MSKNCSHCSAAPYPPHTCRHLWLRCVHIVCARVCACVCACEFVCLCVYVYLCTRVYTCVCTFVHTCLHMCVYACARVFLRVYVCVCACLAPNPKECPGFTLPNVYHLCGTSLRLCTLWPRLLACVLHGYQRIGAESVGLKSAYLALCYTVSWN